MDLTKAIICSAQEKNKHCLLQCLHGVPHLSSKERDANCKKPEFCNLSDSTTTIKVQCKKLNKKQRKEFEKENIQGGNFESF